MPPKVRLSQFVLLCDRHLASLLPSLAPQVSGGRFDVQVFDGQDQAIEFMRARPASLVAINLDALPDDPSIWIRVFRAKAPQQSKPIILGYSETPQSHTATALLRLAGFSDLLSADDSAEKIGDWLGVLTKEVDDQQETALAHLVENYRAKLKADHARLLEFAQGSIDQAEVRTIAHAIAGSAGSLGLNEVSNTAFAVEAAIVGCVDGEHTETRKRIEAELETLLQAIAEEISTIK
jgi:HPt (histidine-containing phosphotransfer) domain-containing protein